MCEYKYSIGVQHKATGEKLRIEVWAENIIGPDCEYIWTGSGPVYENNQLICREKKD